MIRKILTILVCAAFMFSLTGCSNNITEDDVANILDGIKGSGTDTSDGGSGHGKRPDKGEQETSNTLDENGNINWDNVPYADEGDFKIEYDKRGFTDLPIEDSLRNPDKYAASFEYIEFVIIHEYVGDETVVKIPERIGGKPVLEIDGFGGLRSNDVCFLNTPGLKVKLPSTVDEVTDLFRECDNAELYFSEYEPPEEFPYTHNHTVSVDRIFTNCQNIKVHMPSNLIASLGFSFDQCTFDGDLIMSDNLGYVDKWLFGEQLEAQYCPKNIIYAGSAYDFDHINDFFADAKKRYEEKKAQEESEAEESEPAESEPNPAFEPIDWASVPYAPASDFEYKDYVNYNIFGPKIHGVTITKYWGDSKLIKIPETLGGKPVVEIDPSGGSSNSSEGVFARQYEFAVKLPKSLIALRQSSFFSCHQFAVYIDSDFEAVKKAGGGCLEFNKGAFGASGGLKLVISSTSPVYIDTAFQHVNFVEPVALPDTLIYLASDAFTDTKISLTYKGNTYGYDEIDQLSKIVYDNYVSQTKGQ